jgi:hypothetical protein
MSEKRAEQLLRRAKRKAKKAGKSVAAEARVPVRGKSHWGHCSISISNTRFNSRAQLMRAGAE